MYKVRFHLQKGKNYMKWQIKDADGTVTFHDPAEVTLYMRGCFLKNQKGTAQKIYDGASKDVCAWVEAEEVDVVVIPLKNPMNSTHVAYDPRVAPYWRLNGENVDGLTVEELFTSDRRIFMVN
jgi:hypothetical protein